MALIEGVTPGGDARAARIDAEGNLLVSGNFSGEIGGGSVTAYSLGSVTTDGVTAVALPAGACAEVVIDNLSGSDLRLYIGENYLELPTGTSRSLPCLENSNEWGIALAEAGDDVTVRFLRVTK